MPPERNLTAAEIRRKINKPIMEKKRRQRINKCLEELKEIVIADSTKTTRPNKLEKADILEMTVLYLRRLHAKGIISKKTDLPLKVVKKEMKATAAGRCLLQTDETPLSFHINVIEKRKGYAQCAQDTISYLQSIGKISAVIQNQVFEHLMQKCQTTFINERCCSTHDNKMPNDVNNSWDKNCRPSSNASNQSNSFLFSPYPSVTHLMAQRGDGFMCNQAYQSKFEQKGIENPQSILQSKSPKVLPNGQFCYWGEYHNGNTFGKTSDEGKTEREFVNSTSQYKEIITVSSPQQDSSRGERLCSSNDSGNWSGGSRSATPDEVYYEEPAIHSRLLCADKNELSEIINKSVWRPWEI